MNKEEIEKLAANEYPFVEERGINEQIINATQEENRHAFIKGYQKANEWISVEDMLPANGICVIIVEMPEGNIEFGENLNGSFVEWKTCEERKYITHWQPLPKAPNL